MGLGLRRAVELLVLRKIDPDPLLKRAGLSSADLANRDLLVPAHAEARFIELAARAADDALFEIHMAEGANPREAGLLFYLFNAAAEMRQALTLMCRYVGVANASFRLSVAFSPAGATVEILYVGLRRRDLKQAAEYHLASVIRILREIAGRPLSPLDVAFAHHRSFAIREVERYFGCSVQFDAPSDRLRFSADALAIPVAYADERLLEILQPYCDQMAALRTGPTASLRMTVENEIQKLLPDGQARIETIANAVGVSTRSLGRRLSEEGTSFSEVLDDLRRMLSLQYLAEPGLSIEQITHLLGYGDTGSFSHAFRRWTGSSPSQVRGDPLLLARFKDDLET